MAEPTTVPFGDWYRAFMAEHWGDWRFRWAWRWRGLWLTVTLPITQGWHAFRDAHKALARMRRRAAKEIRTRWR